MLPAVSGGLPVPLAPGRFGGSADLPCLPAGPLSWGIIVSQPGGLLGQSPANPRLLSLVWQAVLLPSLPPAPSPVWFAGGVPQFIEG